MNMSNRIITSQSTKIKTVFVGKQKKQTIVVEIVDEINQPVSGINYTISNQEGVVFSDKTTNELGQIIIEDAEYRDYWLTLDAQPFVSTMENRSLRVDRNKSTVELRAKDEKCNYRYAVIGELCDSKPRIGDSESLPDFHFPNKTFKGVCLPANTLNKKLIIEVCPFRAWNFVFENTDNYSLINAYNMALLSNIAYLKNNRAAPLLKRQAVDRFVSYIDSKKVQPDGEDRQRKKSVNYFFNHACLDLDDQPYIFEEGIFQLQPIVKDVPFRDRYTEFNYLSSVDEEGSTLVKMRDFLAGHSTQLFYILSRKEAIIVWRGTETTATDINTDLKFSQITEMLCEVAAGNLSCVQDTKLHVKATVHKGFQTAFNAVVRKEVQKFFEFRSSFENRKVFIGGHSLGGALALLYAITQRDKNIVLYTYGMPRTINKFSVDNLNNLVHYRHVNENDIVPTVPAEMIADGEILKVLGPFTFLFTPILFLPKLIFSNVFAFFKKTITKEVSNEIYLHQGNLVAFITVYSDKLKKYRYGNELPGLKLFFISDLDKINTNKVIDNQMRLVKSLKKIGCRTDVYRTETGRYACIPESNAGVVSGLNSHSINGYIQYIFCRLMETTAATTQYLNMDYIESNKRAVELSLQEKHKFSKYLSARNMSFIAVDDALSQSLNIFNDEEVSQTINRFFVGNTYDLNQLQNFGFNIQSLEPEVLPLENYG